jgi:twinkle protein
MSSIVGDEPCPECRKDGHDRTGNHLIIFEDGGKHCPKCGYTTLANGESKEEFMSGESAEAIASYAPYEGDPIRGIDNTIRALYGDRVGVDESSGEPERVYYRKGKGWKVRTLDTKGFYSIGKTKGVTELYGMGVVRSQTLIICGGEEDAKAAHQMMSFAMPHRTPCCVSLPDGESNFSAVSSNLDWVHKHKRILLCLDMDSAGLAGTNKLAALIDREVLVVQMPHKDPNDCLLLGAEEEFVRAVVDARPHSPGGIVRIEDIMEEAMLRTQWGVSFPWPSLTRATYGMRSGELYFIGAGIKCGKSAFLDELVAHLLSVGEKCFIIKGEEQAPLTARKLAGKIAGKVFHIPSIEVDDEEVRGALEAIAPHVILYDRDNSLDWDEVKAAIRHAAIVEGCKFVFIDPLVTLTDGMEPSEANTFLQKFSRELAQMSVDLGFCGFCFTHLNNPRTGPEHNRGGRVLSSQFTGSRAMGRACHYMIGLERDKSPELDEVELNTTKLVLLEDRVNGNSIAFDIFYNKENGTYLEPDTDY